MFLIDRLGRKTLLVVSMSGMALAGFAVASGDNGFQIVIWLLIFAFSYGLGLGSIPWLIVGELIPEGALGHASSISTGLNWGSCYLVALLSPMGISSSMLEWVNL
jgi:SP family facilitated glucose transporter-like MFS transporter 3